MLLCQRSCHSRRRSCFCSLAHVMIVDTPFSGPLSFAPLIGMEEECRRCLRGRFAPGNATPRDFRRLLELVFGLGWPLRCRDRWTLASCATHHCCPQSSESQMDASPSFFVSSSRTAGWSTVRGGHRILRLLLQTTNKASPANLTTSPPPS